MTRKNYNLIADALLAAKPCHQKHDAYEREAIQAWSTTVTILANRIEEAEPNFDRERFVTACGLIA